MRSVYEVLIDKAKDVRANAYILKDSFETLGKTNRYVTDKRLELYGDMAQELTTMETRLYYLVEQIEEITNG